MIRSMTGFGRSETATKEHRVTIEIKAVNHRYCDLNIKLPKKLSFFETTVRNQLKQYIQRGKIDIFITYEEYSDSAVCVTYNKGIASAYMTYFSEIQEEFQIPNDMTVSSLARFPEVFTIEEKKVDDEQLEKLLERALQEAATKFVESRVLEGEHLKDDLVAKLDEMLVQVTFIEERYPALLKEYREKLEEKIHELLEGITVDDTRIATEVAIYADKICVDEETVRLRSHIENTKATLLEGGCVGRKLDFIAQEMNREANTILSKANSLDITNAAITLKTEIEKVREQIQNIE